MPKDKSVKAKKGKKTKKVNKQVREEAKQEKQPDTDLASVTESKGNMALTPIQKYHSHSPDPHENRSLSRRESQYFGQASSNSSGFVGESSSERKDSRSRERKSSKSMERKSEKSKEKSLDKKSSLKPQKLPKKVVPPTDISPKAVTWKKPIKSHKAVDTIKHAESAMKKLSRKRGKSASKSE